MEFGVTIVQGALCVKRITGAKAGKQAEPRYVPGQSPDKGVGIIQVSAQGQQPGVVR